MDKKQTNGTIFIFILNHITIGIFATNCSLELLTNGTDVRTSYVMTVEGYNKGNIHMFIHSLDGP